MKNISLILAIFFLGFASCKKDDPKPESKDPDKAEKVEIDRFSDAAATLMKRSASPDLPGNNEPVSFDEEPFITKGLGPQGEVVEYYNFDVQPTTPAAIYAFFKEGETTSVEGQLNVIDVIPGEPYYSDFWLIHLVRVPADYVVNSITSLDEIKASGYTVEPSTTIVNCPVIPEGSTAGKRLGEEIAGIHRGWYKGKVVYYFTFEEAPLNTLSDGSVPLSPIYVCFNINPDANDPSSGPPSGDKKETGSVQTHNVVATLPADAEYSPLWFVKVYDNADFDNVSDLNTAKQATLLIDGAMNVNCPVVSIVQ